MMDKNEYELYFLIGSTNVKKQLLSVANGKLLDNSLTFRYDVDLKKEIEEFDDLGIF